MKPVVALLLSTPFFAASTYGQLATSFLNAAGGDPEPTSTIQWTLGSPTIVTATDAGNPSIGTDSLSASGSFSVIVTALHPYVDAVTDDPFTFGGATTIGSSGSFSGGSTVASKIQTTNPGWGVDDVSPSNDGNNGNLQPGEALFFTFNIGSLVLDNPSDSFALTGVGLSTSGLRVLEVTSGDISGGMATVAGVGIDPTTEIELSDGSSFIVYNTANSAGRLTSLTFDTIAVPEPSQYGLIAGALGVFSIGLRRRR